MSGPSQLENPFFLARALEPLCRGYLKWAGQVPGRNLGFRFLGHRSDTDLASKTRYERVRELDESDPLRAPLLRWVHRLTEMRVNQLWLDEDERLYREVEHAVREPRDTKLNLAAMKKQALAAQRAEAEVWWTNIERCGRALSAHRAEYFQRCTEVYERLGEENMAAGTSCLTSGANLTELMAPLWPILRGLLEDAGAVSFSEIIRLALGEHHTDGWPARLHPDSMLRLLSATELFRAVPLQMGALPARLSPASFLRTGHQLGRALCLGWAPTDRPFVLLRDPDDLWGHRLGYVLLLWQLSPIFDEKALGLGRARAQERRRSGGQMLCAFVTLSAIRTLWFETLLDHRVSGPELAEVFSTHLPCRREPIPRYAALSALTVRRDEGTRFAALCDAALLFDEYVQMYDEDWWRNPRALQQLRAEHSTHAETRVDDQRVRLGQSKLCERLMADLS